MSEQWNQRHDAFIEWDGDTATVSDATRAKTGKIHRCHNSSGYMATGGWVSTGREWYVVEGCSTEWESFAHALAAALDRTIYYRPKSAGGSFLIVCQEGTMTTTTKTGGDRNDEFTIHGRKHRIVPDPEYGLILQVEPV